MLAQLVPGPRTGPLSLPATPASPARRPGPATVLWLVVAVVVIGRGFLAGSPGHAGIYPTYARGGADWLAGRPVYPAADGYDVFRYHPLFAAAFAPFGAAPLVLGSVAWRAGLVLFAYTSFRRWLSVAAWTRGDPRAVEAVMALVAPLVAWDLVAGQTNALIAALLVRAAAATTERRWWPAALWLATASLLKLFPLGFAALLIVARPRQLGPRFAVAVAALSAAPFLFQHPTYVARMYADWVTTVTADTGRHAQPLGLGYRDVRFLANVWVGPVPAVAYTIAVAAFWVAALAIVRRWRSRPAAGDYALAVGGIGMTLLGPCTEVITYALLGPSLAAAAWATRGGTADPRRLAVGVAYLLMAAGYLAFLFPFGSDFSMLAPQAAAAVLFAAALVVPPPPLYEASAGEPSRI